MFIFKELYCYRSRNVSWVRLKHLYFDICILRIVPVLLSFYWNRATRGKHFISLAILPFCSSVFRFLVIFYNTVCDNRSNYVFIFSQNFPACWWRENFCRVQRCGKAKRNVKLSYFFCQTNQDTFQVAIISQSDLSFLPLFSIEILWISKPTVLFHREATFLERSGS